MTGFHSIFINMESIKSFFLITIQQQINDLYAPRITYNNIALKFASVDTKKSEINPKTL